jgi:hypothetical protein
LWRRADAGERRGARAAAVVAVPAILIPVVLAFVSVDYVIARNLIAAWVPAMTVVAVGFGARRAGRLGVAAAAALGALSLALLVGVATDPQYQRGDWRGVARGLGPIPEGNRALVVSPGYGVIPLTLYAGNIRSLAQTPSVAEIAIVAVAERRTGQTPSPPRPDELPQPPPGFGPPDVELAETYTLIRYRVTGPLVPVTPELLLPMRLTQATPDVVFQQRPG